MEHVEAQLDAAKEREEMTERQPDSPAFCWATELAMTQQPVTLSVTEAREVSAEMQRLHAENESLQARIKTMAEEHADELMVAHLDGRMQPAPAAAPTPPAQAADSVLEDAARLDWLLLHISGAEFRRIGVHYSGNASRADVDAARKQGANHD